MFQENNTPVHLRQTWQERLNSPACLSYSRKRIANYNKKKNAFSHLCIRGTSFQREIARRISRVSPFITLSRCRQAKIVIDRLSPNLLSARRLWPRVDPRACQAIRVHHISIDHVALRRSPSRRVVNRRGCPVTRSWHPRKYLVRELTSSSPSINYSPAVANSTTSEDFSCRSLDKTQRAARWRQVTLKISR